MASLVRTAFRLNAYSPLRTSYYTSRSTLPRTFQPIVAARLARRTLASAPSSSSLPPSDSSKNDNGKGKTAESRVGNASDSAPSPSSSTQADPAQTVKPQRQAFASLDFAPPDPSEPEQAKISDGRADLASSSSGSSQAGKRTGAKSAKDSLSSIERRRRKATRFSTFVFITMLVGGWIWIGRDEEGKEDGGKGIGAWISRSNKNTLKLADMFDKPAWEKLLPDPLPEEYQRPYTLVISIDDLLVGSTWDRHNGWRTAKRPGVEYFLGYLSTFYEIVLFTTQSAQTSFPIVDQLDPFQQFITYHLFRESTRSYKGHVVKDISYLNRDPSKIIAIDTVPERYMLQPENAIILPKWKPGSKESGGGGDTGLVGLIPFLESIAILNVQDVRPVVEKYQGKDIAVEYAKNEALNKELFLQEWREKHKKASGLSSGGWTISRLLGQTPAPPKEPLSYLEQNRAQAQEMYKHNMAYLEANKEEFLKQKQAIQDQMMKEATEGGMIGMLGRMGLGPPPPPPSMPGTSSDKAQTASDKPTTPAATKA